MKKERQQAILNLIANEVIDTQETLISKMSAKGYKMTQATISRDMQDLNIHKIRTSNGQYKYISGNNNDKLSAMLPTTVKSVKAARNIVVVKCNTGMANAACAVFDSENIFGVVGTLSGDDTFIIITDSDETAKNIENRIFNIIDR